jgi:NADPH2:quinone reductase
VLLPGDAPTQALGSGQGLVEVAFTNITVVETQVRAGTRPFTRDDGA